MPDRSSRLARTLVAIAASFAVVLGAVSAYGAVTWQGLGGEGTGDPLPSGGVVPTGSPTSTLPLGDCADRACNYLLLGSDSRAGLTPEEQQHFGTEGDVGGDERADTIMLVHSEPGGEGSVILSFPRDLWVQIPEIGWGKLNSSFSGGLDGGGPLRVAKTIANLTGLRVDHYLYVDFAGFQDAVNALGGVELCLDAANANEDGRIVDEYSDLDVAPGCQRLDGFTALAYVRARHLPCDDVPDFARIGRQQQFFRALITQMLRPSQLIRASDLVAPVMRALHRDAEFEPGDLLAMVGDLRGATTGDAATFRAVPGTVGMAGELSVVRMDPSAEKLFAAIREGRPASEIGTELEGTPISPANVTVAVYDDASVDAATGVETFLGNAGFDVSPGIRAATDIPANVQAKPQILYAPGHDREAAVLASYLPGVAVDEAPWLEGAAVAVHVPAGFVPQEQQPPAGEPPACPST
jgi:LCP family protein required for cell wall assembly